jgi:hypothetical protein
MHIRKVESHVQIANQCAPRKITSGAEKHVLQALQLQKMDFCRKFQAGQA